MFIYICISFIIFLTTLPCIYSQKLVEFDGHLLQRIKDKGQELGSWRAGLKGTVILATDMVQPNSRRGIAYTDLIDIASNSKFFETIVERSTGLIIIVPIDVFHYLEQKYNISNTNMTKSEYFNDALIKLREFEQNLLTQKYETPLYFAWQTQELSDIFMKLQYSNKIFNPRITITTKLNEPKLIEVIKGYNFVGWISNYSDNENKPLSTIAIVAHYDIFTNVPGFSIDSTGTSSGFLAFVMLLQQFVSLMNEKNLSSHKLLFLLMSGATSDYFGLRHWLSKSDHLILESIDFALCLDSLGDSQLNLHISKPIKSSPAQKIIDELEKSASIYGQNFSTFVNKINVSGNNNFAHEPFSRQGIQAATFSNSYESSSSSKKSILNNKISDEQKSNIKLQTKIIAEAIGHYIYQIDDYEVELFDNTESLHGFFESWKFTIENSPRFFRTMKKADPFYTEIENLFVKNFKDYQKLDFILTNDPIDYYEDSPVKLILKKTKSPLFDAFHLFFNVFYLTIIYLIVSKGKGFTQIKSWIWGKSNVKKK